MMFLDYYNEMFESCGVDMNSIEIYGMIGEAIDEATSETIGKETSETIGKEIGQFGSEAVGEAVSEKTSETVGEELSLDIKPCTAKRQLIVKEIAKVRTKVRGVYKYIARPDRYNTLKSHKDETTRVRVCRPTYLCFLINGEDRNNISSCIMGYRGIRYALKYTIGKESVDGHYLIKVDISGKIKIGRGHRFLSITFNHEKKNKKTFECSVISRVQ